MRRGLEAAKAIPKTLSAFLLKLLTARTPVASGEQARSGGSIMGWRSVAAWDWEAKSAGKQVTILIPRRCDGGFGSARIGWPSRNGSRREDRDRSNSHVGDFALKTITFCVFVKCMILWPLAISPWCKYRKTK